MLCHFSSGAGDGQLYGSELVLGLVAQQFQFGGVKVEEGGTFRYSVHSSYFNVRTLK